MRKRRRCRHAADAGASAWNCRDTLPRVRTCRRLPGAREIDHVIAPQSARFGYAAVLVVGVRRAFIGAGASARRSRTCELCSPQVCTNKPKPRLAMDVDQLRASLGDDALEVATASDVLVRALILNGRATQDETLALARQTLASRKRASEPGTASSSRRCSIWATCWSRRSNSSRRSPSRSAPSPSARRTLPRQPRCGEALDHLGRALAAARRYDEA